MDQAELGRRLGCSRSRIGKIERAETRLDIIQMLDLCGVLKIDIGRLVGRLKG